MYICASVQCRPRPPPHGMVPKKRCGCSESVAWMDGSLFDTDGIDRALHWGAVQRSIDGRAAVERIDDLSSMQGLPPSHRGST